MAGAHDPILTRDVLTSLLNGIGCYTTVEEDKWAKKQREEKRKMKAAAWAC